MCILYLRRCNNTRKKQLKTTETTLLITVLAIYQNVGPEVDFSGHSMLKLQRFKYFITLSLKISKRFLR